MKRFQWAAMIAAFAAAFFLQASALAQKGLYFGARGGLSFTNARVNYSGSETDAWGNTRVEEYRLYNQLYSASGGTGGVAARYNFKRWFGLQTGLDFYQLRNQVETSEPGENYPFYGVLSARDYLHFPLTAVFTGDLNGPRFRFGIGPYLSVLTSAQQMNPFAAPNNSTIYAQDVLDERGTYKPVLWGIEINTGIDFQLGRRMRLSYDAVIRHSVSSAARRAPAQVYNSYREFYAQAQVEDYREHNVFVGLVLGIGAFFPRGE